ncbi:MAG: Phosphoserine phosphatase RsbU [Bacteroidota bacterium]|jgi:sigma-B regulation protein RsbU (phosphoserine phosphatase)
MNEDKRRSNRKALNDFKLNALLEITHAINNNVEVDALLGLYRSTLEGSLGIEKLILYCHQGNWQSMLHFGFVDAPPDIEDAGVFNASESMSLSSSAQGSMPAFDIVIPIVNNEVPIAFLLVGDVEEDKRGTSPVIKHMKFIQTITNIVLVAIQNKRLAEENLRQVRIRKELELAAEMQSMLVPVALPNDDRYDVSAVYKPHLQVGGDYYDFIELSSDKVMFCMADVSGKGVSAAFLMANFQAYLMSFFTYLDMPLEDVVRQLNMRVMKSAMGEKYITLFIGTFDRTTRKLEYINCGHNPPVLMHPSGSADALSMGTIGLGMFDELPHIQKGMLTLTEGTLLVCYTDGLVEQENEAQEEFGTPRLSEICRKYLHLSSEEINIEILRQFNDFRGAVPYIDDTALLTCKFY